MRLSRHAEVCYIRHVKTAKICARFRTILYAVAGHVRFSIWQPTELNFIAEDFQFWLSRRCRRRVIDYGDGLSAICDDGRIFAVINASINIITATVNL